jgi:non-canonical poly(A) RNA polymerase PAPD5/7
MVIDPHDPRNDLTGGSRNINTIRRCFSDAYRTLQKKMAKIRVLELKDRANQSLLAELFAGAYRNFEVQRERLREVHSRRWDSQQFSKPQKYHY